MLRFAIIFMLAAGQAGAATFNFDVIALSGRQAPGFAPGRTYFGFFAPTVNNHGDVAYVAWRDSGDPDTVDGVYLAERGAGAPLPVAKSGDSLPGVAWTPDFFGGTAIVNDAKQVGFVAQDEPGTLTSDFALLRAQGGGGLTTIAQSGDPVPSVERASFGEFSRRIDMNEAGEFAFVARIEPDVVSPTNAPPAVGIFKSAMGAIEPIALEGDTAGGETIVFPVLPDIANTGEVAFTDTPAGNPSIFEEAGGMLARTGGAGDMVGAAGSLRTIEDYRRSPSGNLEAGVLFVDDGSPNAVSPVVAFDEGGGFMPLFSRFDAVPGLMGDEFNNFFRPLITDTGHRSFSAEYGLGVNAGFGAFASLFGGPVMPVLLTDDMLDVGGGDMRIVESALAGGINDIGQIALLVGFADDSRAIVLATPDVAPIPLPAAGWLLLGSLGALATMGRRRRC